VLDKPTQEVRSVELTFSRELYPGDKDVQEEQREEKLDGVWLNRCAVVRSCIVELSRDVIESHGASP